MAISTGTVSEIALRKKPSPSLPNLATPVLNQIRAEAMEEAAKIANEHEGVAWAVSAIRNRKAELEKANG